jgi:DNA-binding CsgD family transcriptional regulator
MIKLLSYLIFIISVALTAAGIILASRLRNKYRSEIFSYLLYFQVFIYAFGFYGIWGQVVIKTFLSPLLSPEILLRLSDIAMLMGLPFLVFAWLMLIRFTGGLSGKKRTNWFVFWFLIINFSIIIVLGYFITRKSTFNTTMAIREYYIIMNLVYFFLAAYLIHFPWKGQQVIHDYDRKIIAPSLFLIMIAQCVPLLFLTNQTWLTVIFVFAFFIGNTFLPVYFTYGTLLPSLAEEPDKNIPFDEFCKKYEVSPRESDVIREICNGLSNKEISDKLFISLQTVKDHTHHIYIKTNVKSRVQLINLVKDLMTN